MGNQHEILAVIFDFDDTLVPDSTTKLIQDHGLDPEKFWGEDVKALIGAGFDPTHAYLKLLLDNIGPGKPLGELTNEKLREFGQKLAPLFFQGLQTFFDDLQETVKQFRDMAIEFYIISGGLQEVIEGCDLIRNNFTAVYGCQLAGDTEDGTLKYIKKAITFTEKTRFIFEINKGIDPKDTRSNPLLVNMDVREDQRRIPFKNMIYAGDGMTDIPCFSLLKSWAVLPMEYFMPIQSQQKRLFNNFSKRTV